jgi:hypothetical protein
MVERTTVRLPQALARSLRRTAAEEGTTMTALLEEGARHVVEERRTRKQKPRVMPRISTAGRGQPATVGLIDLDAIEEQEDIERLGKIARRLNDPR